MTALGTAPRRPAGPRPALLLAPAALGLALVLAGCGGDDGSATDTGAGDQESRATVSASPTPDGASASPPASAGASPTAGASSEATQVAIVSQTAAGGEVYPAATALSDDQAVQTFGAQFTTPQLAAKVTRVVARTDVPAGQTLWGAVVAIGCDVPAAVVVTSDSSGGVLVQAAPAKPSGVQCLAPVTSVALVLVPDA